MTSESTFIWCGFGILAFYAANAMIKRTSRDKFAPERRRLTIAYTCLGVAQTPNALAALSGSFGKQHRTQLDIEWLLKAGYLTECDEKLLATPEGHQHLRTQRSAKLLGGANVPPFMPAFPRWSTTRGGISQTAINN